jgi:hypothetical protein
MRFGDTGPCWEEVIMKQIVAGLALLVGVPALAEVPSDVRIEITATFDRRGLKTP